MDKVYLKRVVNNGVKCVYAYNDKEGTDLKAIFNGSIVSYLIDGERLLL